MGQKPRLSRFAIYAGASMAIGAALGLLFGLMLLENVFIGPIIGAVVGAVVGMVWDLQSREEGTG